MGKLSSTHGTVSNLFQIGIGGSGVKTLRMQSSFRADLTWNPTANQSIALPDASGTAFLFEQAASISSGTTGSFPAANKVVRTDGSGYLHFTLFYNVLDLGTSGSIGRKHTRSVNPPTNPQLGDTWDELDGSNKMLYGWRWWWDGTYWLSPDQYWSYEGAPTAAAEKYVPHNGLNIYVKGYRATSFFQNAQTMLNYWTFTLNRRTAANAITSVLTFNTIGGNTTNWQTLSSLSTNTHVNVSSTSTALFVLNVAPVGVGGAGQIFFTFRVIYQFARP